MMKQLTLLAFSLIALSAIGQHQSFEKIKYKAEQLFDAERYSESLEQYQQLLEFRPNSGNTHWHLGLCYMHSLHQEKALPHFEKAKSFGFERKQTPHIHKNLHDKYVSQDLDFNLAVCLHLHHEFDNAILSYEAYKDKIDPKHHKHHDKEFAIVDRLIEMCNHGKLLVANAHPEFKMTNLGNTINSEYPDYTPLITEDENTLVFTSRRPNRAGLTDDDDDGLYMEDVYTSKKQADGTWGKAEALGTNINTEHHDACLGLSGDGNTLFIYRDNNHGSGDIYVSYNSENGFSEPKKLHHHINTLHFEASASLSPDGKHLYFVSDRHGGKGEKDIYVASLDQFGEWTNPVNLGETINSEYNEESPFLSHDGQTLYFSSKGHSSMGGYDIFKSEWNDANEAWGTPVNVGYPINTADDDLFYVVSNDGKRAYFSTHHEDSIGDKDIYMVTTGE